MPLIREPRTAEARGHQMRIAAVLASVTQKYGGEHSEVFSPDFINVHRPGDRWFCTICFAPMACTAEGHPVASNNGVERDGETQRLTVHCSDKDCKKRQCKAIKLAFKDSASMSDIVLKRIMALMRETSAQMEKSLGEVLIPARSKNSKNLKTGKNNKGGKFSKITKCKFSKMSPGDDFLLEQPVATMFPDMKVGKGCPELFQKASQPMGKLPPPALREVAELLLDISDRIPFGGVDCSSIKMWNSFDRKTRMCKTTKDLVLQAIWLVGKLKPNVFHTKWLATAQASWLEECSLVQDIKHCKYLIQRLEAQAVNWEAVSKLWQKEMMVNGDASYAVSRSSSLIFSRRSGVSARLQGAKERWSSVEPVQLSGWRRPKKITFVLGMPADPSWQINLQGLTAEQELDTERANEWEEDFSEGDEDSSSGLDDAPTSWADYDGAGVKHDRGFLDPGSRSSAQDFGSPAVASIRKSPLCSPFAQPRQVVGPDVDMEASDIGGEDLRNDSDFEVEDKAGEFDGHTSMSMSSMSTEQDFGDASCWRSTDLHTDLGMGLTDLGLPSADLVLS